MRSIIFTSLAIATLATSAAAESAVPLGCFERHYSADHIAQNPTQIVDWIQMRIEHSDQYDETYAYLVARFIDQGRVKGTPSAGQVLDQGLICGDYNRGPGCAVECDGGSFTFVKISDDSVTIELLGLSMGETDGCGGSESLGEVMGQTVRYRLYRVDDAVCKAN